MQTLTPKFEEVQLIYRNRTKADERPNVHGSKAAYKILRDSWDMAQINLLEESKILLLDRRSRLMSVAHISTGGMAGTVIDPKIVFAIALKRVAHSIIIAHNHPSGNLKPSTQDIRLTKHLALVGMMLQLPLEDHLIITQDNYCSLNDEGYMDYDLD